MNRLKRSWKSYAVCLILLLCLTGVTASADEYSNDNSLSSLGIENAVSVSPEFEYSTVEYEVVVAEGTEELILNPTTSHEAAVYEISGEKLTEGKTTVSITVTAESGEQAVYTLYVKAERPNAAEQIAAANEQEADTPETVKETSPQTEIQTELVTERESEGLKAAPGVVKEKVEKLKSDTDFSMKVIYGLIAFSVILLFAAINLILKNRDLKDDLRDAQEKLELQTNEFARKERYMATENYYAPTQQQAAMGMPPAQRDAPVPAAPQRREEAPVVEEAFGAAAKQPVTGIPAQPMTGAPTHPEAMHYAPAPEETAQQKQPKKDVNVTMIDL